MQSAVIITVNIYWVLTVCRALFQELFCGITALILPTAQWGWYYCYAHYTAKATKAQKGEVMAKVTQLGLDSCTRCPKSLTTAQTASDSYKRMWNIGCVEE